MAMKYTTLGSTGEPMPIVGMGMGKGIGNDAKTAKYDAHDERLIRLGIDLGMTLIDVAYDYGCGRGEEAVGRAVKGIRDRAFIATKFAPEKSSYKDVIASAEESLQRFKTDRIDLYQTHWPNPKIPLEETLSAMEKLAKDGKIRHIGLSNCTASEAKRALAFLQNNPPVTIQHEYNLLDRTAESQTIPFCTGNGITFIGYSPLAHTKLSGNDDRIMKVIDIAARHGLSINQLVLYWLTRKAKTIVLTRTSSEDHLRENAMVGDPVMSPEVFDEISTLFPSSVEHIPATFMWVGCDGTQKTYTTLEEALENRFCLAPSPVELAGQIISGEILKPVKVLAGPAELEESRYEVVEGKLRYWAWVIAHGKDVLIPSIIKKQENTL